MSTRSMIQYVHIADGFADDCDELIQRCLQSDTLNYNVFCNIWKDMNFAYIFQGRMSGAEIAELSEEVVHIAKRYMLTETSNFEENVSGLFLVYALLHLQPYRGFAPLRLTPQDLDIVHHIDQVARGQKRYDVLYILGSLLMEGPVQFHIADREYGLESQIRKHFEPSLSVDRVGVRARGVYFRQNEELDIIRELSSLSRRYSGAKAVISGGKRPDATLSYVDEHLASELAASLTQLVGGSDPANIPATSASHEETVQSIKHRAMKETVSQMRHIISVNERIIANPPLPVSPTKSDIRAKPGKIKIGSPKNPIPTSKRKLGWPKKTTEKNADSTETKKSKKSADTPISTNSAATPKSTKTKKSKKSVDSSITTNSAPTPKTTKTKKTKKSVDLPITTNSTTTPKSSESAKSTNTTKNKKAANTLKATSPKHTPKSQRKRKDTCSAKNTFRKKLCRKESTSSSNVESISSISYADSDIDVSTDKEKDSSIENAETMDEVLYKLKKKEEAKKIREDARKKAAEDRKRVEAYRNINMEAIDEEIKPLPIANYGIIDSIPETDIKPDLIMPDKPKRVRNQKVLCDGSKIVTRAGGRKKTQKGKELLGEEGDDGMYTAPRLKKTPLHEMKRTHLKSKLRRMGLLNVYTGAEGM